MIDSTFSRNQLQALIEIKKNKVMSQWTKRLCVLSGTRLLMYKGMYSYLFANEITHVGPIFVLVLLADCYMLHDALL